MTTTCATPRCDNRPPPGRDAVIQCRWAGLTVGRDKAAGYEDGYVAGLAAGRRVSAGRKRITSEPVL